MRYFHKVLCLFWFCLRPSQPSLPRRRRRRISGKRRLPLPQSKEQSQELTSLSDQVAPLPRPHCARKSLRSY